MTADREAEADLAAVLRPLKGAGLAWISASVAGVLAR